MGVILDTDHLTILLRESPEADRLLRRLDLLAAEDIATTIVSFQEQVQGWLAFLNQSRRDEQILRAYAELEKIRGCFQEMNVLPFDAAALELFKSLRKQCGRLGTLDLRIASIAHHGFHVVEQESAKFPPSSGASGRKLVCLTSDAARSGRGPDSISPCEAGSPSAVARVWADLCITLRRFLATSQRTKDCARWAIQADIPTFLIEVEQEIPF